MNTHSLSTLEAGEKETQSEYYDRIYVGFWDGSQHTGGKLPYPWVDDIDIREDWSNFSFLHFSLRINNALTNRRRIVYHLDPTRKTTFKFLSDNIPDVRSLFLIRGKRYIAEKLTCTFTENGMSADTVSMSVSERGN